MRSLWVLAWLASPALAVAGPAAPVVGGADAKSGKWPDAAAILFPTTRGDQALCSGTLIAPTVVVTAGHCFDETRVLPDNVLIGAASLDRPRDGETIAIATGFVYPDADVTEDLTVLILARRSTRQPRAIATGWARTDIVNGQAVALVGYGAVDRGADLFVAELQEARSKITDADCTRSLGCNDGAQPAGELGAGGNGVDTCPGDSGGPLYLTPDDGTYLGGVTSRTYDDPTFPCSEGGIYVRPDKLVPWIERVSGVNVTHGPEPTADPITAVPGGGGDGWIDINDPGSDDHRLVVTTPPRHAQANVRDDGAIRVCADPDAAPGDDALTVTMTDTKHSYRTLAITIPLTIAAGTAMGPCDLNTFAETGGCCETGGRPGGALPLALGVLAVVRRRRSRNLRGETCGAGRRR